VPSRRNVAVKRRGPPEIHSAVGSASRARTPSRHADTARLAGGLHNIVACRLRLRATPGRPEPGSGACAKSPVFEIVRQPGGGPPGSLLCDKAVYQ